MESRITGQELVNLKKEVTSFNAQLKQQEGRRTGENLDKDAFLKLLTIQMSKQDPLSPMKNTEFVAQMAQFTSLEQMKNMNSSMEAMNKNLAVIPGFSMIGKEVSYYDEASENYLSGTAESILLGSGGEPMLVVEGRKVALEDVTSVKEVKVVNEKKFPFPKFSTLPTLKTPTPPSENQAVKESADPSTPQNTKLEQSAEPVRSARLYEENVKVAPQVEPETQTEKLTKKTSSEVLSEEE